MENKMARSGKVRSEERSKTGYNNHKLPNASTDTEVYSSWYLIFYQKREHHIIWEMINHTPLLKEVTSSNKQTATSVNNTKSYHISRNSPFLKVPASRQHSQL